MAKTIMISDDVYKGITGMKRNGESYTQLLARLAGMSKYKKGSILECAGLWSNLSDKEIEKRKKLIEENRKNWREAKW